MKILKADKPLKEPMWKYNGFGIPTWQLKTYDAVQTRCSYRNLEGKLVFPHLYQIDCKKGMAVGIPHKDMTVIPLKAWDVVTTANETGN